MQTVGTIGVDPARASVYEHGWQSWSPATRYPVGARPVRPRTEHARVMNWRPDRVPPPDAFWGEGLLVVDPGSGEGIHLFAARPGSDPIPSIRAEHRAGQVLVSADADVEHLVDKGPGGLSGALARWADRYAGGLGGALRAAPTVWCSWYQYLGDVTEGDVRENLAALDRLDLAVDVVQVDDGYQDEIGDWLVDSPRYGSLRTTVAAIRESGRRAGVWLAPFLVGERSDVARSHPEWLVEDATAGSNWGQRLFVLDVTHPDASAYLTHVLTTMRSWGVDYFKVDFMYAGAIPGRRRNPSMSEQSSYRYGLQLIRDAIDGAYLLGCGAPILPSVGLVDAMRISPDIAVFYAPRDGEDFGPSQRAAVVSGRGRAWQHGRFWVNDADCLVARPAVERREEWAAHVERYSGLRASSDRLAELDDWGLATTRRLLRPVPAEPFDLDAAAGSAT